MIATIEKRKMGKKKKPGTGEIQVCFRLPKEIVDQIDDVADVMAGTRANIVRRMVEEQLPHWIGKAELIRNIHGKSGETINPPS